MQLMKNLANRVRIAGELFQFFLRYKWWWLTPMLLLLFFVGVVVAFTQSSAIAPFIYTLF